MTRGLGGERDRNGGEGEVVEDERGNYCDDILLFNFN